MALTSTEPTNGRALVAPSPDAVAELTRPDGRVLVLGEHLGRLRDLAEGLLRIGCRVEIAALSRPNDGSSLGIADHRLTIVDAIQLGRSSTDLLHAARADAATQPIIAITSSRNVRHRIAGAHHVVARVDARGDLDDTASVVHDILSMWSAVRPLIGPGDLRVDRIGGRVSVRGRQLALRPIDFRLLRALAEHFRHGCALDELCAAAFTGPRADDRRALADVRQSLERLRSLFRRTDVSLVSTPERRYSLTTRADRLRR